MTTGFHISAKALAILAVGLTAPVLSGCIRTDDGTLLMTERPMFASGAMDPGRYSTEIRERREREARTADFPHPPRDTTYRWRPREDRPRAPQVGPVRVGVAAPFKPTPGSDKALTCRNETTASGRVKVVCE